MKNTRAMLIFVCSGFLACQSRISGSAADQGAPDTAGGHSKVESDGTVDVPSFTLPFSSYASNEARQSFFDNQELWNAVKEATDDIPRLRRIIDEKRFLPLVAKQKARYAIDYQSKTIGGVYTEVFNPREGVARHNRSRVLINLHGGGFLVGARTVGQIESIPIAATARIKIVSVDYRQGPENKFPAASEDVASVYKELLKEYRAANIGIFGCSAGGLLTAEALVWFQKEKLPRPGAVGIFCASAHGFSGGDSRQLAGRLGEAGLAPPDPTAPEVGGPYFLNVDARDPLALPYVSSTALSQFPPTLFVTGSRSYDMSGAIRSQIELTLLGVDARLSIWDGMLHGFLYDPELPESREAYQVIANFFERHLGT